MRVPHTINSMTKEVYTPSSVALRMKDEAESKIRSYRFNYFANVAVDSLKTICVQAIAKKFEKYPIYDDLLPADKDHLVEILSTDLPLTLTIPLIELEHYWKRRYIDHWGELIHYKHPGWTWKCSYLERHVRKIVEYAEPQYNDELDHDDVLKLCYPYVHTLHITQLQHWSPSRIIPKEEIPVKKLYPICHIDLGPILKHLTNLNYLEICFQMKDEPTIKTVKKEDRSLNYDPHTYKVDPMDMERLALALRPLENIRCLKVHKSKVECAHIKKFVRKMLNNEVLQELDLSFCKIGDDGGKYIGKLITTMSNLKILCLRGNKIGKDGTHGIAWALQQASGYSPLQTLDLSLNPLGNEGISNLSSALMRCTIPADLRLRGVGLTGLIAVTFASVLKYNRSLKELDLTLNEINEDAGRNMIQALTDNYNLVKVDMRKTGLSEDILSEINRLVTRNKQVYLKEQGSHSKSKKSLMSTISSDFEISTISY